MPTLASWTAIATFLAAGITAVMVSVSWLLGAGRLWERDSRVVGLSEANREHIQALKVEIQRLWAAIAETEDPPGEEQGTHARSTDIPVPRFRELLETFQQDEISLKECDELLSYLEGAIEAAEQADRTDIEKRLRIFERGVESTKSLRRQGLAV